MKPIFTYSKNTAGEGYVLDYAFQPGLITIYCPNEEVAIGLVDSHSKAFFAGAMRASALIKFDTERLFAQAYEDDAIVEVVSDTAPEDDTPPLVA